MVPVRYAPPFTMPPTCPTRRRSRDYNFSGKHFLVTGQEIEHSAQAMRAPTSRGQVLARTAWRYFDGTCMPESEKLQAHIRDYERFAAEGRAQVATAIRAADGTFLPR